MKKITILVAATLLSSGVLADTVSHRGAVLELFKASDVESMTDAMYDQIKQVVEATFDDADLSGGEQVKVRVSERHQTLLLPVPTVDDIFYRRARRLEMVQDGKKVPENRTRSQSSVRRSSNRFTVLLEAPKLRVEEDLVQLRAAKVGIKAALSSDVQ